jgi:hypothetical protein
MPRERLKTCSTSPSVASSRRFARIAMRSHCRRPSWVVSTSSTLQDWTSITSSADGMDLAAVAMNTGRLYTSSDGDLHWIDSRGAGTRNWTAIASSADGQRLVAADFGGSIYLSTDGGLTWSVSTSTGAQGWNSIAASADGMHLAAAATDIYTSSDGGAHWTDLRAAGTRDWTAITSSADGQRLIAADFDDFIHRSPPSPIYYRQDISGLLPELSPENRSGLRNLS